MEYKKVNSVIGNKIYTLFIADTEEKRNKGLSGIPSLKSNEGMLFIFEKPDFYHFWMKDMQFPLDFIFINENQIVDFIENLSPRSYPNSFTSKERANKIIELKSGEVKKISLKKGTNITFITIN